MISGIRRFFLKLFNVFGHKGAEAELAREFDAHLDLIEEQFRRKGLGVKEARIAAKRAFGGVDQAKELYREERSLRWLEQTWHDVAFAVRMLAKSPGFTATALLTLAIGIGSTTAIFSQVNAVFWRTLPVSRPEELRSVLWTAPKRELVAPGQVLPGPLLPIGETFSSFSYIAYESMRDGASNSFSDLACWVDPGEVRPVVMGELGFAAIQFVSGNFFRMLGVTAAIGRTIQPEDDQTRSNAAVAVASYRFWQRAFGGDPDILNKQVNLNGRPFVIVGVMPREFFGLDRSINPDLMVPMAMVQIAAAGPNVLQSNVNWALCNVVGRLRSGVSDEQARADAEGWVHQAITSNPPPSRLDFGLPKLWTIKADQGTDNLRSSTSEPIIILMIVVSVTLLIACANLAGLLLARGTSRRREIATRLALGAPRVRLVRQLLTESLLLAVAGGLSGVALAYLLNRFTPSLLSQLMPMVYGTNRNLGVQVTPDFRVLAFSAAVVLLTGLVFGLAPALRATRVDLLSMMKLTGTNGLGRSLGFSSGKAMVAFQAALSMLLLIGAGLFIRTVTNLRSAELGYQRTVSSTSEWSLEQAGLHASVGECFLKVS